MQGLYIVLVVVCGIIFCRWVFRKLRNNRDRNIESTQRSIDYLEKSILEKEESIKSLKEGRLQRNKDTYAEAQHVKHINPALQLLELKEVQEDISWDNRVVHMGECEIEDSKTEIEKYKTLLNSLSKEKISFIVVGQIYGKRR